MDSPLLLSEDSITELDCDDQILVESGTVDICGTTTIGFNRKGTWRLSYRNQVAATISLHFILVSIYVALLGVYSEHYEHRVIIPLNETWMSTMVTTLSQLIGTVLLTIR